MNEVLKLILTTKIGITEQEALATMKASEKHAVWIANQIKSFKGKLPKDFWENIKRIMEWSKKTQNVNVKSFTYKTALSEVEESDKSPFIMSENSLKNKRVVAECTGTEFKWVELKTSDDCCEEGIAMKHCLKENKGKGYLYLGARVFSLRDKHNKPVITLQLSLAESGQSYYIGQYSAKCNNKPSDDYAGLMLHLEKQMKLRINASSKYAYKIPVVLDMVTFQESLDEIIKDYKDGEIDRRAGDTLIQRLISDAKKFKLKVNVSPDLLNNYVAPPEEEESLEYDDDGSLIC